VGGQKACGKRRKRKPLAKKKEHPCAALPKNSKKIMRKRERELGEGGRWRDLRKEEFAAYSAGGNQGSSPRRRRVDKGTPPCGHRNFLRGTDLEAREFRELSCMGGGDVVMEEKNVNFTAWEATKHGQFLGRKENFRT